MRIIESIGHQLAETASQAEALGNIRSLYQGKLGPDDLGNLIEVHESTRKQLGDAAYLDVVIPYAISFMKRGHCDGLVVFDAEGTTSDLVDIVYESLESYFDSARFGATKAEWTALTDAMVQAIRATARTQEVEPLMTWARELESRGLRRRGVRPRFRRLASSFIHPAEQFVLTCLTGDDGHDLGDAILDTWMRTSRYRDLADARTAVYDGIESTIVFGPSNAGRFMVPEISVRRALDLIGSNLLGIAKR